jgi:hypothetical protein
MQGWRAIVDDDDRGRACGDQVHGEARASAHLWVILVKCNACALGRLCVYLPRCGFHDNTAGG